jgi:hypothetical protein
LGETLVTKSIDGNGFMGVEATDEGHLLKEPSIWLLGRGLVVSFEKGLRGVDA